tara:strand:- start:2301 stop:2483 length:183 start_codon:yes stop_codon:yes gene_type:complete
MTQNDALQALISAVTIAQRRGAYSLEEASAVHQAVTVFTKPSAPAPDAEAKVEKEQKKKK